MDQWGIETVCWDFDGTLVDTKSVFNEAMVNASGFLLFGEAWGSQEEENGRLKQAQEFKKLVMDEIVWSLRPEFGVNPTIMEATVKLAAQVLTLDLNSEQVDWAVERVRFIYSKDVPVVFEGAMEVVGLINKTGTTSVLTTHAEADWTWNKQIGTGFVGKFEQVVHFSIDEPKSVQWVRELVRLGVDPRALLVVGDNLEADIQPPVELGARGVWVLNGQLGKPMDEYPLLRERVTRVGWIREVIEAIIREE